MSWVAIAIGAAMGALARAAMVHGCQLLGHQGLGILLVNVLGCFIAGCLLFYQQAHPQPWVQSFFMVGLLGGFTTFSAFSLEMAKLVQQGAILGSLIHGCAHVVLPLFATWLGFLFASFFLSRFFSTIPLQ